MAEQAHLYCSRVQKLNLGHCEEMTPPPLSSHMNKSLCGKAGVGPVKSMLIDDAASDYEPRISTLKLG